MAASAEIMEYSFKPKWNRALRRGHGAKASVPHLMVGIELEMVFSSLDGLHDYREDLAVVSRVGPDGRGEGKGARIVLKHDGSLPSSEDGDGDEGVETVFHPAHVARLADDVVPVVNAALAYGAYHNHPAAGMHVHTARTGLCLQAQGAFVLFWNKLQDAELYRVAGRYDGDYSRRQDEALTRPFMALLETSGHRYRVDTTRKTMEVRVFRSELNPAIILARAELVDGVAAFCRAHPLVREERRTGRWRETYTLDNVTRWMESTGAFPNAVRLARGENISC